MAEAAETRRRRRAARKCHDKRTLLQAMAWAEKQYHGCLLDAPEAEPRGAIFRSAASRPRASSDSNGLLAVGTRLDFAAGEQAGDSPSTCARAPTAWRRSAFWPGRRTAAAITTGFAAGCCFRSTTPKAGRLGSADACCRSWATTSPAKYLNSPETPLFTKSKLLYGLDLARETLRKNPDGDGHGGLHRRDRGPSVWVPERRGRAGHGVGRVAHSDSQGPRRSDRSGARRR